MHVKMINIRKTLKNRYWLHVSIATTEAAKKTRMTITKFWMFGCFGLVAWEFCSSGFTILLFCHFLCPVLLFMALLHTERLSFFYQSYKLSQRQHHKTASIGLGSNGLVVKALDW